MTILFRLRDSSVSNRVLWLPRSFAAAADDRAWRAVHRAADLSVPEMRRGFLGAVRRLRSAVPLGAVRDAVAHRTTALIDSLAGWRDFGDALARAALAPLRRALLGGGRAGTLVVPGADRAALLAGIGDTRVASLVQRQASRMVREVGDETRQALAEAIVRAWQRDESPAALARQVRAQIGLTTRQARAIEQYRGWLGSLTSRAPADLSRTTLDRLGRAGLSQRAIGALDWSHLTATRVEQLALGYRDRLLEQRAMTIASHELLLAANTGQAVAWEQAIAIGLLDGHDWDRIWHTSADEMVCQICRPLHGQRAPIGGLFAGGFVGPPAHIVCRCSTSLVRRPAAAVAS